MWMFLKQIQAEVSIGIVYMWHYDWTDPALKLKERSGCSYKLVLNLFGYLFLSPTRNGGSASIQREAAVAPADLGSAWAWDF